MFLKVPITALLVISTSPVYGAGPKFPTDFRYIKDATNYSQLPKRSQLPVVPGNLNESAWFWGPEDGLGRLNFLTPKRVRSSIKECKTGELVPLEYANLLLLATTNKSQSSRRAHQPAIIQARAVQPHAQEVQPRRRQRAPILG